MDSSTYLPIARFDDLTEDVPAHAAADGIGRARHEQRHTVNEQANG